MRKALPVVALTGLMAACGTLIPVNAYAGNHHNDKVWVCHATHSETHPFVLIHVSASAADGQGQNDHTKHQGDLIEGRDGDADYIKSHCEQEVTPSPTTTTTSTVTSSPTQTTGPTSPGTTKPPTSSPTKPPTTTTSTMPSSTLTASPSPTKKSTKPSASGPSSTRSTVPAPVTTSTSASAHPTAKTLAYTGMSPELLAIGLGLLVLGLAIKLITRYRRTH